MLPPAPCSLAADVEASENASAEPPAAPDSPGPQPKARATRTRSSRFTVRALRPKYMVKRLSGLCSNAQPASAVWHHGFVFARPCIACNFMPQLLLQHRDVRRLQRSDSCQMMYLLPREIKSISSAVLLAGLGGPHVAAARQCAAAGHRRRCEAPGQRRQRQPCSECCCRQRGRQQRSRRQAVRDARDAPHQVCRPLSSSAIPMGQGHRTHGRSSDFGAAAAAAAAAAAVVAVTRMSKQAAAHTTRHRTPSKPWHAVPAVKTQLGACPSALTGQQQADVLRSQDAADTARRPLCSNVPARSSRLAVTAPCRQWQTSSMRCRGMICWRHIVGWVHRVCRSGVAGVLGSLWRRCCPRLAVARWQGSGSTHQERRKGSNMTLAAGRAGGQRGGWHCRMPLSKGSWRRVAQPLTGCLRCRLCRKALRQGSWGAAGRRSHFGHRRTGLALRTQPGDIKSSETEQGTGCYAGQGSAGSVAMGPQAACRRGWVQREFWRGLIVSGSTDCSTFAECCGVIHINKTIELAGDEHWKALWFFVASDDMLLIFIVVPTWQLRHQH